MQGKHCHQYEIDCKNMYSLFGLLCWQHEWLDSLVVNYFCTLITCNYSCLRQHQPNHQKHFDEVVKWNPIQQNITKKLENIHESKDNPVGQPLHIVILVSAFNGLLTLCTLNEA